MKIIFTEKELGAIEKVFKFHKKINKSLFETIKEKFIIGTAINERGNTTLSIRPDFVINIVNIFDQYIDVNIPIYRKLSFENKLGLDLKEAVLKEKESLMSLSSTEESDEYEKIRNSSIIKNIEDLIAIGTKDINQIVEVLDGQTPDTMNRIITSTKPTNFLYINDKDLGSFRYDIVTKEIIINPDQIVDYLKYFAEDESEKVDNVEVSKEETVTEEEPVTLEKIYNSDIYADFLTFDDSIDIVDIVKSMNKKYGKLAEFTHYESPESEKEYFYVKDKDLGEFRYQFTTDMIVIKVKHDECVFISIDNIRQLDIKAIESYEFINNIEITDDVLGNFRFNIDEYAITIDKHLNYIGSMLPNTKPNQPIGLKDYSHLFENFTFNEADLLDLSGWIVDGNIDDGTAPPIYIDRPFGYYSNPLDGVTELVVDINSSEAQVIVSKLNKLFKNINAKVYEQDSSYISIDDEKFGSFRYKFTEYRINNDKNLKYIGTSTKPDQPIGHLKNYSHMFEDSKLMILDLSDWDMSLAEDTSYMFYNCIYLKDLSSLKDWDVSNVKSSSFMFSKTFNIENVYTIENWEFNCSFYNCIGMFKGSNLDLKTLKDKWNLSERTVSWMQ